MSKRTQNVKFLQSHKVHKAALISICLALNQTPVYTVRLQIQDWRFTRCACLRPSFRWDLVHLYIQRLMFRLSWLRWLVGYIPISFTRLLTTVHLSRIY